MASNHNALFVGLVTQTSRTMDIYLGSRQNGRLLIIRHSAV